jgi:FkbM family methyltransferase
VEPVAANLAALHANLSQHGFSDAVTIVAAALGAESATSADITVYPCMPGNSTMHPAEKQAAQQPLMRAERFEGARIESCEVRTLSDIIAAEDLPSVDLLKVDVEGAELAVLQGLEARHWALVKQVVLEVLDAADRPAVVAKLLESQGFIVKSIPGEPPCNVMLYATRNAA